MMTRVWHDGFRGTGRQADCEVKLKRKWLKALPMLMMAGSSFMGPMNPREIEELMYIMNQTRIEFTIPEEDDKGEGKEP
jgi:hypothetical protein